MPPVRKPAIIAVSLLILAVARTDSFAQQRFDSGPHKGFLKEEPTLTVEEIPRPFGVRAVRGMLTYGEGPLPDAYFEIRDTAGQVTTARTDERGTFILPDAKPGYYDFKATKNRFESVIGRVIVSKAAPRKNQIRIQLHVGT